jgi:hypothetical protein
MFGDLLKLVVLEPQSLERVQKLAFEKEGFVVAAIVATVHIVSAQM